MKKAGERKNRKVNRTKFPLCKKSEDTTEYVLECEKANKSTLSQDNSKREWEEMTEIYRKKKIREKLQY